MKFLIKILVFILVIFHANISEAKSNVLAESISEIVSSISANSINYEQVYRSYSSIRLKISEEINSSTSQNLKNAISVVRFACKSERDLLDYRNWGVGIDVNAAKTSTNIYKHSFKYADRVRMRGVQDPV